MRVVQCVSLLIVESIGSLNWGLLNRVVGLRRSGHDGSGCLRRLDLLDLNLLNLQLLNLLILWLFGKERNISVVELSEVEYFVLIWSQ